MAALKIVYKDPGQLKPQAKNPRTHIHPNEGDCRALAANRFKNLWKD
jgi:hypothetical protein